MSVIRNFKQALSKHLNKSVTTDSTSFNSFSTSIPEMPQIIESRTKDWVLYGDDNLYPLKLNDLPWGSSIHNSILKTKTKMTHGDQFLINGAKTKEESQANYNALQGSVKSDFDLIYNNTNGTENLFTITTKLAGDLQKYGAFCFEVVWNTDFTKIVTIKYKDIKYIRAGKADTSGEVECYYWCKDWTKANRSDYKPQEIKAFDLDDKENYNQLVYIKLGDLDYYGIPPYAGAITWIFTDFQMGLFHKSNLENGMNPSMWLKFYKKPSSENERDLIIDSIRRQFTGAKNTGKHIVTFSDGKELAPDFQPIDVSNLDKQLLLLAELCDRKILTGHQLTSPLLAGISTSGQIGGNTELGTAYQIFDKVCIEADRNLIVSTINKIFEVNKTPVKIDILPFNPIPQTPTTNGN